MFSFLKNVLFGLGGFLGVLITLLVVAVLGGALWVLLSAIGLVTVGVLRFLLWLLVGGAVTIALLWCIGYLMTGSKNA